MDGSTTGQGSTGLIGARKTIKRFFICELSLLVDDLPGEMCISKGEYEEFAKPDGSTELSGHIAPAITRFVAVWCVLSVLAPRQVSCGLRVVALSRLPQYISFQDPVSCCAPRS